MHGIMENAKVSSISTAGLSDLSTVSLDFNYFSGYLPGSSQLQSHKVLPERDITLIWDKLCKVVYMTYREET